MWIAHDVGNKEHYADVLDDHSDGLFHRSVVNDEADLDALIARAASFEQLAVVIDQPGSMPSPPSQSPPAVVSRSPTCRGW